MVTLLVLYTIWTVNGLKDDYPQQEDRFPLIWDSTNYYQDDRSDLNTLPTGSLALAVLNSTGKIVNDGAYFNFSIQQVTRFYDRTSTPSVSALDQNLYVNM